MAVMEATLPGARFARVDESKGIFGLDHHCRPREDRDHVAVHVGGPGGGAT